MLQLQRSLAWLALTTVTLAGVEVTGSGLQAVGRANRDFARWANATVEQGACPLMVPWMTRRLVARWRPVLAWIRDKTRNAVSGLGFAMLAA
jgi:hypothetical protein